MIENLTQLVAQTTKFLIQSGLVVLLVLNQGQLIAQEQENLPS